MNPLVAVIMGSRSDWSGAMEHCAATLEELAVPHDVRILSAHRTPDELVAYVRQSETDGVEVFIAAAGGAAHLAGVVAGHTLKPVLGVPMQSSALQGLDSLLSTVQMPAGIPVATLAIGKAGAVNAALFAAQILAGTRPELAEALSRHREARRRRIGADPDPRQPPPE
jgi:5-(carboxyamino)imidazole ribonucleotide mutase